MVPKNGFIEVEKEDLPEVQEPEKIVIELDDLPPEDNSPSKMYPELDGGIDKVKKAAKTPRGAVLRSNVLQNVIAGILGGLIGWLFTEYAYQETARYTAAELIIDMGLFTSMLGLCIGAFLGSVEGIVTKTWQKALRAGAVGLFIGFTGGFLGGAVGQFVYGSLGGGYGNNFIIQIITRSFGWSLVGLFVGLGQGMSFGSTKKVLNGLLGGALGGLIGGGLFDIIAITIGGGVVSRMVAMILMGGGIGGAISLVDEVTKEAWLKIIGGPLAGKEFIIFKEKTTIGSSPKCDITIIQDTQVAPIQATIQNLSGKFILKHIKNQQDAFVNNRPVSNITLRSGSNIAMGSTVFSFNIKPRQTRSTNAHR